MVDGTAITEIKHTLTGGRFKYPCRLLERSPTHAVLLYTVEHATQVGGIVLPSGTVTYAYYWIDRPYTVYHWIAGDGHTVAYYLNLADRVTVHEDAVEWRDLALDLLCTPDGRVQVLDEDDLRDAPTALRARVEALRAQVLERRQQIVDEVAAATTRLRSG